MTAVIDTPVTTPPAVAGARRTVSRVPLGRLVGVELRKMFDTRAGFWLMASIGIANLLATASVIAFAPEKAQTYDSFAAAIGFPMAVILPMVAVLAVTGEFSQRTGLTTFTLVPHRGRVLVAKALASLTVAVVSMLLAFAVGALGNLVGTAISGAGTVWDISFLHAVYIVLGNVVGLTLGFTLGLVIRNSPGAIVGYFVISLVLPTVLSLLAGLQSWFKDLQPWVDLNYAQGALFNGTMTSTAWAHLAVTGLLWLVVPIVVGVRMVLRSEIK